MKGLFQRPFPPLAEKSQRFRSAFFIALFVFSFLYLFKPFGLSEVQGSLLLVTALYGLITLTILLLTQLLFPIFFKQYYNELQWTVGKEIFQSMANVLFIAIGNFLLSCYLGFFPWSVYTFVLFVGFTFAIGLIPVTVQALIRQNIYHQRHSKSGITDNRVIAERQKLNNPASTISILGEDGAEAFRAEEEEILAIESSGNYIEVHRSKGKPVLIRKSLNSTEEALPEEFFRTHRSWIVNLPRVSHVHGNARGYILSFENTEIEAPVSRSKLSDFDAKLKSLSRG